MSLITYNNIQLPYAHTTDFSQEAIYDPEGGVDWYCQKYDISIDTIINADYLAALYPTLIQGGNPVTHSPVEIMKVLRSKMLKPRQTLSFKCEGKELIPAATGGTGRVDVKNGPQPQSFNYYMLTNTSFLVRYHIIAHYWENNDIDIASDSVTITNQKTEPVMFNRWSETVEIDNCMFSTKTRDGSYGIRSDNYKGHVADRFRSSMAVLSVADGFLRQSATYTVAPDGLSVSYRIVDREAFKMPPTPAYEAQGDYVETTTRHGVSRWGEVRLRLKGSKITDQAKLVEIGIGICSAKLRINGARLVSRGTAFARLDQAVVRTDMYENIVEVSMRVEMLPTSDRSKKGRTDGVWGIDYKAMVWTPGSDPQRTGQGPSYFDRGTASMLLQTAAYYDPSMTENVLATGLAAIANQATPRGTSKLQMKQGLEIGEAAKHQES